jgi:hypothetical protein
MRELYQKKSMRESKRDFKFIFLKKSLMDMLCQYKLILHRHPIEIQYSSILYECSGDIVG